MNCQAGGWPCSPRPDGVQREVGDMGASLRDARGGCRGAAEGAAQRMDIGEVEEGHAGDRQIDVERIEAVAEDAVRRAALERLRA